MRFLAIYLLALFAIILSVGFAHSEPKHGTPPDYAIWGDSDGSLPELWFEEEPDQENILGYIVHYNQWTTTSDTEMFYLPTSQGNITVYLNRTYNVDCEGGCPDTAEVYDLPIGYVAIPPSHSVAEKSFGRITVYKYQGM